MSQSEAELQHRLRENSYYWIRFDIRSLSGLRVVMMLSYSKN